MSVVILVSKLSVVCSLGIDCKSLYVGSSYRSRSGILLGWSLGGSQLLLVLNLLFGRGLLVLKYSLSRMFLAYLLKSLIIAFFRW